MKQQMEQFLIDAIQRINHSSQQLAIHQYRFGVDLSKLLLAIQGNEASFQAGLELGEETELLMIRRLCEEAQNIDYMEKDLLTSIGNEIDALTTLVIQQQEERFNRQRNE